MYAFHDNKYPHSERVDGDPVHLLLQKLVSGFEGCDDLKPWISSQVIPTRQTWLLLRQKPIQVLPELRADTRLRQSLPQLWQRVAIRAVVRWGVSGGNTQARGIVLLPRDGYPLPLNAYFACPVTNRRTRRCVKAALRKQPYSLCKDTSP